MKRAVIVRHAKTIQQGYDNDFDRWLTTKGEQDAKTISAKLRELNITPDLIISSPAVRARQTAEIYSKALDYPEEEIVFEESLYSGKSPENFLRMLQEIEEEVNTVFIFGHNPSVTYYLGYLISHFDKDVPTCSTVAIDFDVNSWKELKARSGNISLRIIPE